MPRAPHAHLVQLDIAWEDPAANHARARDLLALAPVEPGDFILLPEMFDTGFSFNVSRTIDSGPTRRFLRDLATDLGVTVQGGRTVAAAAGARNVMTSLAPDGSPLAEYAKVHPFQRERERFEPGRDVLAYLWARPLDALTIAPAICYDLRFPELFRRGLLRGAELFAIGACWPAVRAAHWRALAVARAIENQAYVIACNRAGNDPPPPASAGLAYAGGSIAVSPTGDVLAELGPKAGVLSVPLPREPLDQWRASFSAWHDARLL